MTPRCEMTTAILAAVVGAALMSNGAERENDRNVDPRTARELAVLSRVLEKRLGEARKTLVTTATGTENHVPAGNGETDS